MPFDLNTPITVNDLPPIEHLLADERRAVGLLAEQVLHVGEAEHDDVGVRVVLLLGEPRCPTAPGSCAPTLKFVVVPEIVLGVSVAPL